MCFVPAFLFARLHRSCMHMLLFCADFCLHCRTVVLVHVFELGSLCTDCTAISRMCASGRFVCTDLRTQHFSYCVCAFRRAHYMMDRLHSACFAACTEVAN